MVSYRPAFVRMLRLSGRLETFPPSGTLLLRDGGPVARAFENARDGGPSRLSEVALFDLDGAPFLLAGDAFGTAGPIGDTGGARRPPAGNTGLERAFLSGLAGAGRFLGRRG